ncbi:MAG: SDR family NAD(P)-dependent oxidoreductase [Spirochaetales bacterium]|nr:SDR family NAD(P)-dependent oxidoreductase [Spirochaetales bacterium]
MKVLVTGAFGNIGRGTVEELLERGHQVRCFDMRNRENEKLALPLAGRAEICWGNLCRPLDVESAVAGTEVVIHLAFVIPRISATGVDCEDQPDLACEVNVGGTGYLLEAMRRQGVPKIIFASSLHVYGITRDQTPPRRVTDRAKPIENYARHKVECERLVRESGLTWSVFRLAAALPFSVRIDGAMFEIPLDNRMEYVYHRDVGVALAKGVSCPGIWGKVLHIGGGPRCQYTYGQIVHKIMEAAGIGDLPDSAFTHRPFSTDWIDTEESQRLLGYQRHTLDDYAAAVVRRLGFRRTLASVFRPLVRWLLLRQSPYYATRRLSRQKELLQGSLALIACGATAFGEAVAKKLAGEGMRVVLLESQGEKLNPVAYQIREEGGSAEVVAADLSSGRSVLQLFGELRGRFGAPDLLVTHADVVWLNDQTDLDWSGAWDRIESNLLGAVRLSEVVAEEMKKEGRGQLVFIEPALKLFPVRPAAFLHGARSFFGTFCRALARETRRTGVRVSVVKAGISTTELFRIRRLLSVVVRRRYGVEVRPEALAIRIWGLLIRPQPVVYIPQLMALFSWIESHAGWIVELIRKRLAPEAAKAGR